MYHFQVTFPRELFLDWEKDQTLLIKVGTVHGPSNPRMCFRHRFVPVVYAQLLHQLCIEVAHAHFNKGHKAQRQAAYADQVTDLFAHEIYNHMDLSRQGATASKWCSKVLTPILQRQIAGVPDAYLPSIHAGVLDSEDDDSDLDEEDNTSREMTIAEATIFYLNRDPTDPALILEYRHNLLYTRELRWYLSTLLGSIWVDDVGGFNISLFTQNELENFPQESDEEEDSDSGEVDVPPPLDTVDILVILVEGLQEFYMEELEAVVRVTSSTVCKVAYQHAYALQSPDNLKAARARFQDLSAEVAKIATNSASAHSQWATPLRESIVTGQKHVEISRNAADDDDEDAGGGRDADGDEDEDTGGEPPATNATGGSIAEELLVFGHLMG